MVPKFVLFFVFASVLAFSTGQTVTGPPQPGPPTNSSTTTVTPTPETTTLPPTTTTTKSTTAPTTTTPATTTTPPSTTTHATTPTPNTTTTTTPPTNTTSAPTTTTPAPVTTTAAPPTLGKWSVTEGNDTCIIVEMAIHLNISYDGTDNKTLVSLIEVPPNNHTHASGHCGNDSQLISLMWHSKDNSSNVLELTFGKNNKTNQFMITDITVNISAIEFPTKKDNTTVNLFNNKTQFTTSLKKSYHCAKEQKISLDQENSNKTVGQLDVSKVHLQAFHEKGSDSFGAAEDCEGGASSPDVVPIAVGCALVGLVAVVLIAYLVGRRRSQARGYLSM